MKNTFLYLFIFSILFNIYQYVNSNKILDSKELELTTSKNKLATAKDSIQKLVENDIYDLENDDNAKDYFYNRNLDYKKVKYKVYEDIMSLNANKNGNSLVTYEPIDNKPFLINSMKFLNNRWIIAEYSNGTLWGQVLIKYFHNEDKPTDLETIETVLYESQKVE